MADSGDALLVFAKVPEKGKVKTRMGSRFSPEEILAIYIAMLRDVLELAEILRGRIASVSVWWGGCGAPAPPRDFLEEFPHLEHRLQEGGDLGSRMYHAMEEEFSRGKNKVILIGGDVPTLPEEFPLRALDLLECADFVLGPSVDGGYYLIGSSHLVRAPFEGIPWGTPEVFWRSIRTLERCALKVALLPFWYDLDTAEDLSQLNRSEGSRPAGHGLPRSASPSSELGFSGRIFEDRSLDGARPRKARNLDAIMARLGQEHE